MATNEFLTTKEVAEVFHVTPSSVTRWVRDGLIEPAIRTPGGFLRFRRDQIEELAESLAAKQAAS